MSHNTMESKWIFGHFYYYLSLVFYILEAFSNKTSIPLTLVEYEMIIANSTLRTLLAMYHLALSLLARIQKFTDNSKSNSAC